MELIINGDDFGYSESVNKAIITSFKQGIISSSTLMANMPGFKEACELTHENKLHDHVGVHLNLTEGKPLTDRIRRIQGFCDEGGRFCLSREKTLFRLTPDEKKAVFEEFEAQVNRCRRNRIPLTHADSHQHIHTEWAVGAIVRELVKRYEIPYVRLSRNIGTDISLLKKAYKWSYNTNLKIYGLARTQYFCYLDDFMNFLKRNQNKHISCEIMVHPVLSDGRDIVDRRDKTSQPLNKVIESIHNKTDNAGIVSFMNSQLAEKR